MRWFVVFFFFVLVIATNAKGDAKIYSYERIVAKNKIEIKGGKSNLNLSLLDDYPELCIFEDAENKSFAIVAKKRYEKVLGDLVLAYGFENGFQGTESSWKKNLVESYIEQLEVLSSIKSKEYIPRFELFHIKVAPLLKTYWGQGFPYNSLCPKLGIGSGRRLTGCVATAMSQLMYYHKYPDVGKGAFVTNIGSDKKRIDFSEFTPRWEQMNMCYGVESDDVSIDAIAQLMYTNALAVSSDFECLSTSSNNMYARTALVNFYGYAPGCKYIQCARLSEMIRLIEGNLRKSLPVLVSGGSHSFVCDGCDGNYFHFNLGWAGAANGYYKILISESLDDSLLTCKILSDVVVDICPMRSAPNLQCKEIHINEPGTLGGLLTEEEKVSLNSLSVSGKLNGADIAVLRRMAGATDAWRYGCSGLSGDSEKWVGILRKLDLKGAVFVSDNKHPYLRIDANGCRYVWQGKVYDISTSVDSDVYDKFLKTPFSKGRDYRFVYCDSLPYIEFYTRKHCVTSMMFFDCQNLCELCLPKDIRRIEGRAFRWCNSLRSVALPPDVEEIESGAFGWCYLLERINVSKIPLETVSRFSPVKSDGCYGDTKLNRHSGILCGNNINTCDGIYLNGELLTSIPYKKLDR